MIEPYCIVANGTCMGDWFPDGTRMIVDPEAQIHPLDLCAIHLRKDAGDFSRFCDDIGTGLAICKLFIRQHRGAVLACQLNPLLMALIPDEEIVAMHRVAGFMGASAALPVESRALMRMVEDFCQDEPIAPVCPEWQGYQPQRAAA